MSKNILITGATGLIGKRIAEVLISRGHTVFAVTRNSQTAAEKLPVTVKFVEWDFKSHSDKLTEALSNADTVIHLAGENVLSKKWTEEHKKNIYNSRITSTRILAESILKSSSKPATFIAASAVGYYGMKTELPADESSGCGTDFLALLTRDWENAASILSSRSIRNVKIRSGIVLDNKEGALAKMITPFRFFIGGPLGNGKQFFPWIHIDDAAGIFLHAFENDSMEGVYNAAAPETITMKNFCVVMGNRMKRPSFFNVPTPVLKFLYGEGADILLNGVNVIPKRTLESGYKFLFSSAKEALKELI